MSSTARFAARDAGMMVELGKALGRLVAPGDVIVLAGDLGAGKTTLVKGLAEGMGIVEHVTSPSFTFVQAYAGETELVHIDLYRIEEERGLDDLGLGDVLYGSGVVAVEWGDRSPGLFRPGALWVAITYGDVGADGTRVIDVRTEGVRAAELLTAWVAACAA